MVKKFTGILRKSKIEFLRDTEPDWVKEPEDGFILKPLEIHEVPSYV
jgi:hypothetical protein